MTGCRVVTLGVLLCCVSMTVSVRGRQDATPTFRANATMVTVPVSVRHDDRPVLGLVASDFTVTDAGVAQRVERVSFEEVPIDVTLVLDVSGSTSHVVERLRRDARRILGYLRASDRIRILAIDTFVYELRALQPASGQRHGVFHAVRRETLSVGLDRVADDPRVEHGFALELDDHGNARKACTVVYGRRRADASLPAENLS